MHEKFIVYQVLPRLFGNTNEFCIPNSSLSVNGSGKFSDFTAALLAEIRKFGCTHIWYTGILEHSTKSDYSGYGIRSCNPSLVKGVAGSPYAIMDYYDVDPDLACFVPDRLEEFRQLIVRSHEAGLKVIIDFVPNHVSREYYSDKKPDNETDFGANDKTDYPFHSMNNFYYINNEKYVPPVDYPLNPYQEYPAKVTGNDCFVSNPTINDWYETVKLNYGVDYINGRKSYFNPLPDTWLKMLHILNYWAKFGVDGFRCDMAEMVPVEFWEWCLSYVKKDFPEIIFIAEIYNPGNYNAYITRGGFDYLYDKVGLYDYLRLVLQGEKPASGITNCWQSVNDIQDKMLNFLENHDEQRIASDFFLGDPMKALPALAVSLLLNRSPFMIYFGQELGERGMDSEGFSREDGRTSIFDYWSVSTIREWFKGKYNTNLRYLYKQILNLSINEKAFRLGSTYDLEYANLDNADFNPAINYAFIRKHGNELIVVVVNFDDNRSVVKINIPPDLFSFFRISDGMVCSGQDLFTGNKAEYAISSSVPFNITVAGRGVRAIKLLLQ
ncbi:MAG: alpha-amylase family protein [Bacteroidales bacterium]